jgi:hypothetical protein
LCPFSEGNAKWGGDPNVTFEPPMNHLSTLYEVPLNPMKPPPFPPWTFEQPMNKHGFFFLPCPPLYQKGLGVSPKGWPLWYGAWKGREKAFVEGGYDDAHGRCVTILVSIFISPCCRGHWYTKAKVHMCHFMCLPKFKFSPAQVNA